MGRRVHSSPESRFKGKESPGKASRRRGPRRKAQRSSPWVSRATRCWCWRSCWPCCCSPARCGCGHGWRGRTWRVRRRAGGPAARDPAGAVRFGRARRQPGVRVLRHAGPTCSAGSSGQGVVVDHDAAGARAAAPPGGRHAARERAGGSRPRIGGQIQKVDIVGPHDPHRHARVRLPAARVLPAALPDPDVSRRRRPHRLSRAPPRRSSRGCATRSTAHELAKDGTDAADDPGDAAADRGAAAGHRVRGHPGRPADRDVLRQGPARGRLGALQGGQEARAAGASSATPRAATAR